MKKNSKRFQGPLAPGRPLAALVLTSAMAAVLLTAPGVRAQSSERMIIGQFNMAGGHKGYGTRGNEVPEALVGSIKRRSPQLAFVTINEGCKDWLSELDRELSDYSVKFNPVLDAHGQTAKCKHDSEFGNAIIYRDDFSELQERSYDLPSGAGLEQRELLCLQSESRRLVVCATHFSHGDDESPRKREAQRVRSILANHYAGYTVLLGGDLNARPDSDVLDDFYHPDYGDGAHGQLKEAGSSCGNEMKPGREDSCRSGGGTSGSVTWLNKIDYLFVSPEVQVHHADVGSSKHSDHNPLWAEVTVPLATGEPPPSPAQASGSANAAERRLETPPPEKAEPQRGRRKFE
jgi:endonuclease/exonuclease/phosphatase family metal-dependent hydrolase